MMSNFSFFHSVFKRLVLQARKNHAELVWEIVKCIHFIDLGTWNIGSYQAPRAERAERPAGLSDMFIPWLSSDFLKEFDSFKN